MWYSHNVTKCENKKKQITLSYTRRSSFHPSCSHFEPPSSRQDSHLQNCPQPPEPIRISLWRRRWWLQRTRRWWWPEMTRWSWHGRTRWSWHGVTKRWWPGRAPAAWCTPRQWSGRAGQRGLDWASPLRRALSTSHLVHLLLCPILWLKEVVLYFIKDVFAFDKKAYLYS